MLLLLLYTTAVVLAWLTAVFGRSAGTNSERWDVSKGIETTSKNDFQINRYGTDQNSTISVLGRATKEWHIKAKVVGTHSYFIW